MGLGAMEAFGAGPRLEVTLGSPCRDGSGGRMAYQAPLRAPGEAAWQPRPSVTGLRAAGR